MSIRSLKNLIKHKNSKQTPQGMGLKDHYGYNSMLSPYNSQNRSLITYQQTSQGLWNTVKTPLEDYPMETCDIRFRNEYLQCMSKKSCEECVTPQSNCGWCEFSKACYPGKLQDNECKNMCKEWIFDEQRECNQRSFGKVTNVAKDSYHMVTPQYLRDRKELEVSDKRTFLQQTPIRIEKVPGDPHIIKHFTPDGDLWTYNVNANFPIWQTEKKEVEVTGFSRYDARQQLPSAPYIQPRLSLPDPEAKRKSLIYSLWDMATETYDKHVDGNVNSGKQSKNENLNNDKSKETLKDKNAQIQQQDSEVQDIKDHVDEEFNNQNNSPEINEKQSNNVKINKYQRILDMHPQQQEKVQTKSIDDNTGSLLFNDDQNTNNDNRMNDVSSQINEQSAQNIKEPEQDYDSLKFYPNKPDFEESSNSLQDSQKYVRYDVDDHQVIDPNIHYQKENVKENIVYDDAGNNQIIPENIPKYDENTNNLQQLNKDDQKVDFDTWN